MDTFSPNRWACFDEVAEQIRGRLAQLPPQRRCLIARDNAQRLFAEE